MAEKQIVLVLDAVKAGMVTSQEVADYVGLPLKHCSALLGELRRCGLVRVVGKRHYGRDSRVRHSLEYALTEAA
jgi:CRP-like cAMP-binding protein